MRNILLLAGALLIVGCGSADNASGPVDDKGASGASDAPEETVFDPMVGTMDRARGVEDLGMSRKDEMDAALDGAE